MQKISSHKAQSPVAAGQSADENTSDTILGPKPEATLIARFTIKGAAVHRLSEGGFLVCQYGHVKHCPDLHSLAAFARQTGVAK